MTDKMPASGPITKERVAAGIRTGVIEFKPDPNEIENVVCAIGDYWFYFRDGEGACDQRTVEEYLKQTDAEEVIRLVSGALNGFYLDSFNDEYAYYNAVLKESGI